MALLIQEVTTEATQYFLLLHQQVAVLVDMTVVNHLFLEALEEVQVEEQKAGLLELQIKVIKAEMALIQVFSGLRVVAAAQAQ